MKHRIQDGHARVLAEEHALLRRGLALLARYAEGLQGARDAAPELARPLLAFVTELGEERHRRREDALLALLERRGLGREARTVLAAEHDLGRELFAALLRCARDIERAPRSAAVRLRFLSLALRYVELMLAHTAKEEQVLLPLAGGLALANEPGLAGSAADLGRARAWIEGMETRSSAWPEAILSVHGLGTPAAFQRLCAESFPAERAAPDGPPTDDVPPCESRRSSFPPTSRAKASVPSPRSPSSLAR
jgi:hemerythrin-like domain-containing protein